MCAGLTLSSATVGKGATRWLGAGSGEGGCFSVFFFLFFLPEPPCSRPAPGDCVGQLPSSPGSPPVSGQGDTVFVSCRDTAPHAGWLKTGGTYVLTVLGAGSPKSWRGQEPLPSEPCGKEPSSSSPLPAAGFAGGPRLRAAPISASVATWPSSPMAAGLCLVPPFIRTPVALVEDPPSSGMTVLTDHIRNDCISREGHIPRHEALGLQHVLLFGGDGRG